MTDETTLDNAPICPSCGSPIPADTPGSLCPACVLRDARPSNSRAPAAPSVEQIAEAFPDLEIVELIGRGGMGAVYHARQPKLDRDLALKILLPDLGADPAFAERFAREAQALAKLNHPNIVGVYDFGEQGGLFYLTMEFVDGVNLRQAMAAGRFTPKQALAVVPGICDALQAAHELGILHRDIKPENILLDRDGNVKIVDFGIARIVGENAPEFTLTATNTVLGSSNYMAPEQLEQARDIDHRADIYSLGVVFYEMLTGELPIGRFLPPSEKGDGNSEIDEIVMRALEKELDRRFQTAGDVKTEVQNASGAVAPPAKDAPDPTTAREGIAKIALWALGLTAASAVCVSTWFIFPGGPVLWVLGILSGLLALGAAWLGISAMERGEISTMGKPVLQFILVGAPVFTSICAASGIASEILVDFGKGCLYVAILIGALPTFLLARLFAKPARVAFGDSSWKHFAKFLTIGGAAILLIVAFGNDGRWPFAHTRITAAVDLISAHGAIDPAVLQKAVDEAAGKMKGTYRVDVYGGSSVNIDTTLKERNLHYPEMYAGEVIDRLLALLPPEYAVGAKVHLGEHGSPNPVIFHENRLPHSFVDNMLAGLAVGGALVGLGFALLFHGFASIGVLIGMSLVLAVAPALPYPTYMPRPADGHYRLPSIEKRPFVPHFSNPEAAAMTAVTAAKTKDEAMLNKALSSEAPSFLAEVIRGSNIESLRRANEKSTDRITFVEVNIGSRTRHDVVTFGCVLEEGEWKIESYRDPKKARTDARLRLDQ